MRTKLKDIPTLHKHGDNQHTLKDGGCNKTKNITSSIEQRGTGQPYRIAKLKRDYPAIAERLALQLEPLLAAKAKQNQGARTDLCQNSDKGIEPIDTKKEVAKVAGVSHDTVANTHNPITTIRHLPKIRMILESKMGNYTC